MAKRRANEMNIVL